MRLLGLTGGVGTGKSTAAEFFSRHGASVIDTDVIAREIVRPGEPALSQIVAAFGQDVLDSTGSLNRAALADIVFSDPARRVQLESILHPPIRDRWLNQISAWRMGGIAVGVVVIPLLFETGAENHFDSIVCTACTAASQQQRLAARGWSSQQIADRVAAQWPLEKKVALSTRVIWTEGSREIHERQVKRLLDLETV